MVQRPCTCVEPIRFAPSTTPGQSAFTPVGAGVAGQPQLEPLGDAVALDQQDLGLERRGGVALHPGLQQIAQGFRPVAMHQHQARLESGAHGVSAQWGKGGVRGRRPVSMTTL